MSASQRAENSLHVVLAIDSMDSGGAQRQIAELAVALPAIDGIRTTILTYHPANFYAARLRDAGIPVILLPKGPSPDPRLPLRIRRWLSQNPADVIHSFLLTPSLWTWLATRWLNRSRRPVVIAGERNSLIATTVVEGTLQRLVYRGVDAVTVNAEPVADEIASRLGVSRDHVHYLPNGIDLAAWDAALAKPPDVQPEAGCFHLALVGGLRRQKNHRLLFQALRRIGPERLADWRVWCVGAATAGARTAEAIQSEVAGLESCVRFLPAMTNIAPFMGRMDALVLPSLYEGFPNVVLEAMASRVPVVATPVGDISNLVRDGATGYLVPLGDSDALAAGLTRLASLRPEERAAMGRRGRERVEAHFQMRTVAASYAALYRTLLESRAGGLRPVGYGAGAG